jgi:hypothetical protein
MSRSPLSPSDRDPLARLREQLEDTRNAIAVRREEGDDGTPLLQNLLERERSLVKQIARHSEA